MIKKILVQIGSNRILHHASFWIISFLVFANTFKVSEYVQKIDYIYAMLFHISLGFTVYINLYLIIPGLLSKKKYLLYVLAIVNNLLFGIIINNISFNWLSDRILKEYYFISYYNNFDLLKFFIVYISVTTLLKLSKSWFRVQEMHYKLARIERENINSELKALKAQINPHFLFNSLNLLYALAVKNSKHTPEAIIQLSDILRYVTYETKNENIELKSEVELIENYIALQRLRVDAEADIQFDKNIKSGRIKIAPMLFLPLIENSFKHGIGGDTKNTFVHIQLISDANTIHFEIENNKGNIDDSIDNEEGGIGLENIRKRLNLLYTGKYNFDIVETDGKFKVKLLIKNED